MSDGHNDRLGKAPNGDRGHALNRYCGKVGFLWPDWDEAKTLWIIIMVIMPRSFRLQGITLSRIIGR